MPSQTELQFRSHAGGRTQCDCIEAHMRARVGQWIPMPDLYRISGAYAVHSRIADLRKRGLQIDHKNHRRDGTVHSFYRLSLPSLSSRNS